MLFWYFKLFNNIKDSQEAETIAKLELQNLFGNVEPIFNFIDIINSHPINLFINQKFRLQDFITHELPYGRIQGYFAVSEDIKDIGILTKRLSYVREIYLIAPSFISFQKLIEELNYNGEIEKTYHFFKHDDFICFRFITNQFFLEKSEYISKLSRNETEIDKNLEILFYHLTKNIYRIPASSTLSVGKRLEDYFSIREEPSLYLTHYFHPYKGKFHPKLARALINYVTKNQDDVVLDNFVGSGTTLVEATLLGIKSIGIEINPLSVLMSKVKTQALSIEPDELKVTIEDYLKNLKSQMGNSKNIRFDLFPDSLSNINDFSEDIANFFQLKIKKMIKNKEEIIPHVLISRQKLRSIKNQLISDFILLALSGTISDLIRRKNSDFFDTFEERLYTLYLRVYLFKKINEILKIDLGISECHLGDARKMQDILGSSTIDGIVTSPPYSTALDYIRNDYPQIVLLELTDSIENLEADLIGNPNFKGNQQKLFESKSNYIASIKSDFGRKVIKFLFENGRDDAGNHSLKFLIDMQVCLKEMYRVMKNKSKCVIIIGNNHFKVNTNFIEVPNDKILSEIAENIGFELNEIISRELHKSSSGNIREETILILEKGGKSHA